MYSRCLLKVRPNSSVQLTLYQLHAIVTLFRFFPPFPLFIIADFLFGIYNTNALYNILIIMITISSISFYTTTTTTTTKISCNITNTIHNNTQLKSGIRYPFIIHCIFDVQFSPEPLGSSTSRVVAQLDHFPAQWGRGWIRGQSGAQFGRGWIRWETYSGGLL